MPESPMTADPLSAPSPAEQVILVHGTFAGEEADTGSKWWQQDSPTWRRLQEGLPPGVQMGKVFHWNHGPNSYRARVKAGRQLLDRLLELEQAGHGYHLIGHSHGGSVIWECLQWATVLATEPRVPAARRLHLALPHLCSWTTVGTPFIDFAPHQGFRSLAWTKKKFSKPPPQPSRVLPWLNLPKRWIHRYQDFVFFFVGMVWVVLLLVLPWALWQDVQAGHEMNPQALWAIVFAIVFMILFGVVTISQTEYKQVLEERRYRGQGLQRFGRKWLGLVSRHDEAFQALKTSVALELPLIPKRTEREAVFYTDRVFPLTHWVFRQVNKLYNLVIPWVGNRFISTHISRAIQGADRPGTLAIEVRTHPGFHQAPIPPLPEAIDTPLLALANQRAAVLIPHLRSLFYTFTAQPLHLATDRQVDASAGLVHTSYFEMEEVLTILLHHIRLTTAQHLQDSPPVSSLLHWIHTTKQQFAQHLYV